MRIRPALALAVVLLGLTGATATPLANAAPSTTVTIAFDDMGPWTSFYNMDRLFFKSDGIRFSSDYTVGFSNGHSVLLGYPSNVPPFTISASFTRPVTGISASVRMHLQGTADYTIIAYSGNGNLISSSTITLTQNGLDGNFYDVTLNDLPSKAKSFSIVGGLDYGVKSITYTYR
jgi:hypothetical protein